MLSYFATLTRTDVFLSDLINFRKMFPPTSYLNLIVKVFLICSLCKFMCIYASSYERISELTQEIINQQKTITSPQIISRLMEIKSLRIRVGNAVATNVPNRKNILIGLCLHRLVMELDIGRCYQNRGGFSRNYYKENWHANNYIEITQILKRIFESENMQKFIDTYYNMQHEMCKHNILANFDIKYHQMVEQSEQAEIQLRKFTSNLVQSFPRIANVNNLTNDEKVSAFERFLLRMYDKKNLIEIAKSKIWKGLNGIIQHVLNVECANYCLNPLITLMMTYNNMRRNIIQVDRRFGQWIRANDICQMLTNNLDAEDLTNVEEQLSKSLGLAFDRTPLQSEVRRQDDPIQPKRVLPVKSTQQARKKLTKRRENVKLITQTPIDIFGKPIPIIDLDKDDSDEPARDILATNAKTQTQIPTILEASMPTFDKNPLDLQLQLGLSHHEVQEPLPDNQSNHFGLITQFPVEESNLPLNLELQVGQMNSQSNQQIAQRQQPSVNVVPHKGLTFELDEPTISNDSGPKR